MVHRKKQLFVCIRLKHLCKYERSDAIHLGFEGVTDLIGTDNKKRHQDTFSNPAHKTETKSEVTAEDPKPGNAHMADKMKSFGPANHKVYIEYTAI